MKALGTEGQARRGARTASKRLLRRRLRTCALATGLAALSSCAAGPMDGESLGLYERASAVYAQGHFSEAAELAGTLGGFYPAQVLRGKALYFCGDVPGSEKALRRALRLRPSSAEALLYLARLLRESDRRDEARSLVDTLLADDPSDLRALRLGADLATDGMQANTQGAALLDRAVEVLMEGGLAFLDRARLRWISGDRRGALEDLKSARILFPQNSPVLKTIAGLEAAIGEENP